MTTPTRPVPPVMPTVVPGICDTGRPICGKPGRLYAAGYRCDQHQPINPHRTPKEVTT